MGVGLNHRYESLQTWDILQFQSFYNTQDQKKKKNLKQVNITVCYTIIIIQDLLKRMEVKKQNQKLVMLLLRKKEKGKPWDF